MTFAQIRKVTPQTTGQSQSAWVPQQQPIVSQQPTGNGMVGEYNGVVIRTSSASALKLRGYWHISDVYTSLRWPKYPHIYRMPGLRYLPDPLNPGPYKHKDCLGRVHISNDYDDRYISRYDGKIKKLTIQAVDTTYDGPANTTWRRTFIRNKAPRYFRLANWPLDHVDYRTYPNPTSEQMDMPRVIGKWIVATILLVVVVRSPLWNISHNLKYMTKSFVDRLGDPVKRPTNTQRRQL